jgi:hypothetical protein
VQYKIRTAQTRKGRCSMCKLSKTWAHQKLLPSQTKMSEMRRWQLYKPMSPRRKIEWCPVCPANCTECTVYEDLQKKTYPSLRLEIYTPPTHIEQTLYTQPHILTKFLSSHSYRARATHKPISSANQRYTRIKKIWWKAFLNKWELC